MAVRGRGIKITRHWVRWVVRVIIETGSGMDYDTYTEDYSGVEWCNKNNAVQELKEALASGNKAFIERREITTL